ncbi:extracellular solute-binding protein [Tropicimonas sp. IMCC6043]|uniref:extracellular solute-binding protein n=1 Tax=Tropicimonas sp. IMCC6043 TaxID=2510645 RepID=UPI00101C44B7|nr:extracellular solute-binding protein [Tropicimonas sp. IMCC6043]RYH06356.1 ABC transporter substrate-binding protein [Tropicimonas sp. IMCC6043]
MRLIIFVTCLLGLPFANLASATTEGSTVVSHGFSTFGDLKYPPDFPHFDYVNPDAPKGGKISFRGTGASNTFDSLNDFILSGEPGQGLSRLYDTLMVRAWDEPDAVYGLLAERIEYPEDRSYVIFHLRAGARFADGAPVTAADVAFTFETLAKDGLPSYRVLLENVATTDVIDDRTIRIDFDPDAMTRDLPGEIAQIPILPAHYYETRDFTRSTMEPPLGSGPYLVAKADPGRSITYCRNPDYWGADLPVNIGKDNFDCVVYEYFADNTAAFEALKSGEYLFHEEFTSAVWATGYDFPALDRGWVLRDVIPDNRAAGTQGFWINMRRAEYSDPRTRQALAMLFNFEWSNEQLFHGLYTRTDSFFENTDMQAEGLPEEAERTLLKEFQDQLPPEIFTEPAFTLPESTATLADRRALRGASQLLDAAGWTVGDDGLWRNAAGEVLGLVFIAGGTAFARIALPYVENLRRVGIDASFSQIDAAQLQQRLEEFDYDMTIRRFVLSNTPSVELRNFLGSGSANTPGSYNAAGLADPVVDALIDRVIGAGSREEMVTAARALDRVLRIHHIWVPNWHKGEHWLAYWDVFDRPEIKPLYDRGEDYWWFSPEKYEALRADGALR